MINLQLPVEKEKILLEYKKRRLFVFSALIFFALLISICLACTIYAVITINKSALTEMQTTLQREGQVDKFNDFEKTLKDTNDLIAVIKANQIKGELTSELIKEIVGLRIPGIILRTIDISKGADGSSSVNLQGISATRKTLTGFIDVLKKQKSFTEVESPISNLIKDANNDFTVSFKVTANH